MNSRALKQRLAEGKTVFGSMFDYVVNPQWAGIVGACTLGLRDHRRRTRIA